MFNTKNIQSAEKINYEYLIKNVINELAKLIDKHIREPQEKYIVPLDDHSFNGDLIAENIIFVKNLLEEEGLLVEAKNGKLEITNSQYTPD